MRADSLVPSLETCRALREAGFPQEATAFSGPYFVWVVTDDDARVQCAGLFVPMDADVLAAPTLAELLAALPANFRASALDTPSREVGFHLHVAPHGTEWAAYYASADEMGLDLCRHEHFDANPAEAAAQLWLALPSPAPSPSEGDAHAR